MIEKKENSENLQIPRRQVTAISTGFILLAAMIFAGGYFLGTTQAIESFLEKVEQDSLADQVYAKLTALYDQESDSPKVENTDVLEAQEKVEIAQPVKEIAVQKYFPVVQPMAVVQESVKETVVDAQEDTAADIKSDGLDEQSNEQDSDDDDEKVKGVVDSFELVKNKETLNKRWYAQLIGYGLEKSAREFALKLSKKGFEVSVTARTSRSAAGNQRTWYQVVTAAHEDRDLLQKQVDKIVSLEKLKGVQISVC